MDATTGEADPTDSVAPLLGLVDRLRGEVTELQAQWEALVEELEAKRCSLSLAEATVELVRQRGERMAQVAEGGSGIDVDSTAQGHARAEVSAGA
jgi:hypothetical protein